jgi:hypothetical protein
MSKAKTASKNNPTTREKAKEFTYDGKAIQPVKLITTKLNIMAAEYKDSGDLVLGPNNMPLTWSIAKGV